MIVDLERCWIAKARCRENGTDLFFPDHSPFAKTDPSKAVRKQWEAAKEVCIECPVMVQCGRDSLGEPEGVWGGYDPLERAALRRRRTAMVNDLPAGPERRAHAALAHRLANTPKYGLKEAARILGLSPSLVQVLATEREAELKALADRRAARGAVEVVNLPERRWPSVPPTRGDGWVRHASGVARAYYLGETDDGEWLFMKATLSKEDSRSWFRKRDVQLTREVPPHHMTRVGKTSRIYGTTISADYAADRAG